ncbi:MAG: four helix bundle protein [Clostridia bacterium]|nr:four helix bundle protein [Clostridia bacterium]
MPKEKWEIRQAENQGLTIIPKSERYIQYMLDLILKLPRTEKFSIGTEFKTSLYSMMENIIFLSKVPMENRFYYATKIDAIVQIQRIYLRIMKNNKWIDEKKFKVAIELLGEIGKINGGLIKFYAKNNKKSV